MSRLFALRADIFDPLYVIPRPFLRSVTASPNVLFVRDGENNGRGYPRVLCKSTILTLLPARFPLSLADFAQQFSAIVPPARLLRALPLLVPLARFLSVLLTTFTSFLPLSHLRFFLSTISHLFFYDLHLCGNAASPVFLFRNRLFSMLVTWSLKYLCRINSQRLI